MTSLPPIPSWDALHPLIIHFPIALLLIAPLFLIIGALSKPERGRPYLIVALVLMTLGTAGTWVAVSTGEAAGELTMRSADVNTVLEQHEHLAESTRATFSVLTLIFASLVVIPRFVAMESRRVFSKVLPLVFLVAYAAGSILLANTAHQGGRLVHELGVSAPVPPGPVNSEQNPGIAKSVNPERADHDD